MAPYEDRFRIVEARCTAFAKELLLELRNHPQFLKMIERLERIDGPIFRGDVEAAFLAVSNKK